jgi:hypothetical protein
MCEITESRASPGCQLSHFTVPVAETPLIICKAVGFCVCAANSTAQTLKGCGHWEPPWEPSERNDFPRKANECGQAVAIMPARGPIRPTLNAYRYLRICESMAIAMTPRPPWNQPDPSYVVTIKRHRARCFSSARSGGRHGRKPGTSDWWSAHCHRPGYCWVWQRSERTECSRDHQLNWAILQQLGCAILSTCHVTDARRFAAARRHVGGAGMQAGHRESAPGVLYPRRGGAPRSHHVREGRAGRVAG